MGGGNAPFARVAGGHVAFTAGSACGRLLAVDMHRATLRFAARLLAGLCCLLPPALSMAQVTATGDYLARMDVDRDGRVALTEYQAWMGYAFERMDADHDGVLVPGELPGGRGRTVVLAEHREALAAAFHRQDANGDGFLDAAELAAPPR